MKKKKFSDLKFVRCIDPAVFMVVPRRLWESIPGMKDEYIDNVYRYAAEIMTVPVVNENGVIVSRMPSVNVWFAILYDEVDHLPRGFLWAEFDPVFQRVFIQACAVDREYQSTDGEVLKGMTEYIRGLELPEEMRNNIQIATTRPAAFQKAGLKRSKNILMELRNGPETTQTVDKGQQERTDVPYRPE